MSTQTESDSDFDYNQTHDNKPSNESMYHKASIISRYFAVNLDVLLVSLLTLLFYYFIVNVLSIPEHSSQLTRASFVGFYTIFIVYFTILPLLKMRGTIGCWITRSKLGRKDNAAKIEVEVSFLRAHLTLFFVTPIVLMCYISIYHSFIDATIIREEIPEFAQYHSAILLLLLLMVGQIILLMFYGSILIIYWSLNALFPKLDYTETPHDHLCKTMIYKKLRTSQRKPTSLSIDSTETPLE